MASSSAPAKSQQLHNFELPDLWNKDGQSSCQRKRRRSIMMSPSQRQKASSASRLPHPPVAMEPFLLSPLRDSVAVSFSRSSLFLGESSKASRDPEEYRNPTVSVDSEKLALLPESSKASTDRFEELNNSTAGGESKKLSLLQSGGSASKLSLNREEFKNSPVGGESKKLSLLGRWEPSRPTREYKIYAFPKFPSKDGGNSSKRPRAAGDDEAAKKKSKALTKIHGKNKKKEVGNSVEELTMKTGNNDEDGEADKVEEEGNTSDDDIKIWDLRPRTPKINTGNKSVVIEGKNSGVSGGEKKQKKTVSLSIRLTKKAIDEDIYALTGRNPSKRPKRRPKNVQKQMDRVFPGQWLVSISPDSYKVSLSSIKGN